MDRGDIPRGLATGQRQKQGTVPALTGSRCFKQRRCKQANTMKKIVLALRFPSVWPKAPTVGAAGGLQYQLCVIQYADRNRISAMGGR